MPYESETTDLPHFAQHQLNIKYDITMFNFKS